MTGVVVPTGAGAHAARPEGVLVLGRHAGMLDQGLSMLAHEGYLGVGVVYHDESLDDLLGQLARGVEDLAARGRQARVLVTGGAIPAAVRSAVADAVAVRWPGMAVVEHVGSLQRLFEEVLDVLASDPR